MSIFFPRDGRGETITIPEQPTTADKINYLASHGRYGDAWAHRVKVDRDLDLTPTQQDKALDVAYANIPEWEHAERECIAAFETDRPGLSIYSDGRTGGYLIMGTDQGSTAWQRTIVKANGADWGGMKRLLDEGKDLQDVLDAACVDDSEVDMTYAAVRDFDITVSDIRDEFIDFLDSHDIIQEEHVFSYARTITVAVAA